MKHLIFHVDVNSAYLSWEAARRVSRGEEDIRLIPSAIGGDREKRTGVILAKSIPAKKFGIRTGEPVAMALRKCPDLFLARPDFLLYEKNSKAFMDICREYTPVVEKYSIDECFLDMSGMGRIYSNYIEVAAKISRQIYKELGFTVNIGISTRKILAKMASDFKKPNMIHTLFPQELEKKLWPLPVGKLFSVGRATEERLSKMQIRTIEDLAKADPGLIKSLVGEKIGKQIHEYANGIDDTPVLDGGEEAKGYSCSTTLDEDVEAEDFALKILLSLVDGAASRMRSEGVKAFCISVTIRSNDFKDKSHQIKLSEATDITTEIYNVAKMLFRELWDRQTPLRLLGVALTELTREEILQQSFFFDEEKEKLAKLDKAMDSIRNKFGTEKLSFASTLKTEDVAEKYKAQMKTDANPRRKPK